MAEIWDAYDKKFNIIDGITLIRGESIPEDMYHLVCEIILKHYDGTYLLMKRDYHKHFGGMWELTAGGSALKGETPLECAKRELCEETGICTFDLQEVKRIIHDERHTHYVEFFCVTDCDKNSIRLQKGETVDFRWVDKDELLDMEPDILVSSRARKLVVEFDL